MSAANLIELPNEAAWKAERRNGVGASDVPTILGLTEPDAPWHKDVYQLWAEKTGEAPAEVEEQVGEWRYWGLRLEPVIAEEYERRTRRPVLRGGSPYVIATHHEFPWLRATLDATTVIDGTPAPLQLKTAGQTQRRKWIRTDRKTRTIAERLTPLDYQCQSQIEQFVMGATVGSFAVLIGGNTFEWRDVPYDSAFMAAALPIIERFWKHCEQREPLPEGWPNV